MMTGNELSLIYRETISKLRHSAEDLGGTLEVYQRRANALRRSGGGVLLKFLEETCIPELEFKLAKTNSDLSAATVKYKECCELLAGLNSDFSDCGCGGGGTV